MGTLNLCLKMPNTEQKTRTQSDLPGLRKRQKTGEKRPLQRAVAPKVVVDLWLPDWFEATTLRYTQIYWLYDQRPAGSHDEIQNKFFDRCISHNYFLHSIFHLMIYLFQIADSLLIIHHWFPSQEYWQLNSFRFIGPIFYIGGSQSRRGCTNIFVELSNAWPKNQAKSHKVGWVNLISCIPAHHFHWEC